MAAASSPQPIRDAGATTAERLLDAAQRLFVEHDGVEAVSARAITRAAGVNSAALHYHFGSKEGLLEELIVRRTIAWRNLREPRLRRVERRQGAPTPSEIAEAWARPLIDDVRRSGPAGRYWVRLVARGAVFDDAPTRHRATQAFEPERHRLEALLERALPELDPRIRRFRLWLMVATTFRALASIDDERSGSPQLGTSRYADELVGALSAVLSSCGSGAPRVR